MRKVKILKKYLETLLDPNYSFFLLTKRVRNKSVERTNKHKSEREREREK